MFNKTEFNDIFKRLRVVESEIASKKERDIAILEKIEDFRIVFSTHDDKEMVKYNEIQKSINSFIRDRNYIVGAVLLFEVLQKYNIITF